MKILCWEKIKYIYAGLNETRWVHTAGAPSTRATQKVVTIKKFLERRHFYTHRWFVSGKGSELSTFPPTGTLCRDHAEEAISDNRSAVGLNSFTQAPLLSFLGLLDAEFGLWFIWRGGWLGLLKTHSTGSPLDLNPVGNKIQRNKKMCACHCVPSNNHEDSYPVASDSSRWLVIVNTMPQCRDYAFSQMRILKPGVLLYCGEEMMATWFPSLQSESKIAYLLHLPTG